MGGINFNLFNIEGCCRPNCSLKRDKIEEADLNK